MGRATYYYATDCGLHPKLPVATHRANYARDDSAYAILDHGDWPLWRRDDVWHNMSAARVVGAAIAECRAAGVAPIGLWGVPSTHPPGFGLRAEKRVDLAVEALVLACDFACPTLAPIGAPESVAAYLDSCRRLLERARAMHPHVVPCGADRSIWNTPARPKWELTQEHKRAALTACVEFEVRAIAWWWPIKAREYDAAKIEADAITLSAAELAEIYQSVGGGGEAGVAGSERGSD